jgi:hypothetical protein
MFGGLLGALFPDAVPVIAITRAALLWRGRGATQLCDHCGALAQGLRNGARGWDWKCAGGGGEIEMG